MGALDHITQIERDNPGSSVAHVIVVYAVDHPPSNTEEFGGFTYGYRSTPGKGMHETVGLLRTAADDARDDMRGGSSDA